LAIPLSSQVPNPRVRPNSSSELLRVDRESRTKMPDLVFNLARVGDRVRDFIA
jgi:hypothetical protein